MMNDPTKSDTAAKASRNVLRKPSDFFTWSACWAAATSLVMASRPFGSTGWSRSTSWGLVTPAAALTEMTSNSPRRWSTRWAVGTSHSANLAPARLSAEPKPTMPTTVYVPVTLASILIRSPTAKCSRLAVPASMATSSGPLGARPSLTENGESVPRLEAEAPKFGACPPTILPSRPTIAARPCTYPPASATPLVFWITASSDAGTGPRSASAGSWGESFWVERIWASVFPLTSAKRLSKEWASVSVSTNVPATKPTPSTTDRAVSASRSLWARRPLIMTRRIGLRPLVFQGLEAVEDPLRRRPLHLVDDVAVGQEHRPVGVAGGGGVVGDHDDRLAEVVDRLAEEAQHLGPGPGIEVAGGLVGEHDPGPGGQRPGHRHPLLLPTRQLGRPVAEAG